MRVRFVRFTFGSFAAMTFVGCSLIAKLDPNDITGGTTSSSGGMGGTGGNAQTTAASTGGSGGSGGAACSDPVADCPATSTACVVAICDAASMCATENAQIDTPCTDNGGQVCDGSGSCVGCTDAALHCPDPMNECLLPDCAAGQCSTTPVLDLTETVAGQITGDCKLQVCDGAGSTKVVDDDDPLDDGFACTIDTCVAGVNTPVPAMPGAACSDSGGTVCGSNTKMGICVQCIATSDCSNGDICDTTNDNFV